jgi:A/G-specific adenine glycosylase
MMKPTDFHDYIWEQGKLLYRDMPWRREIHPYYILVSELMLQQTQVERVIPKFEAFIQRFPDTQTLAESSLSDVVVLWNGLGYNRRAKYLHDSSKRIMNEYGGLIPHTVSQLMTLPGVGPGTAGAIAVYAFNQPIPFIETNVRTVYFQHFFSDVDTVSDSQLLSLVEKTIDREHPREFYWALMDYGSWLKHQGSGRITKSLHYKKQAALIGSIREVRGQIIRQLSIADCSEGKLRVDTSADERFDMALAALMDDGLVMRTHDRLHLTK